MKVVVVIPTYNEKENTLQMIDTLAAVFASIEKHEMSLLYVDANSPDGTADVVKAAQKQYKWLHLLVETKKEGLGRAYAKGMRYAMDELKADYIMEFDGDFQHPQEKIPEIVSYIDQGYDYIIGSRYIRGGSIPEQWGLDRKFLSVVGNLVARVLLILPKVHDVTGGFKLARVKGFMNEFDFDKLLSRSFAYKIHLLFFMVQKGAKVKEVPITFRNRTAGESKIIKNEMQETLRVIFLLQLHNPKIRRFLKYGMVGFLGLVLQTTIFEILGIRLKLFSPSVASIMGGETAIISNFIFNNLWTFKKYKIFGIQLIGKFLQFNATSFISLGVQFVILKIGESVAGGNDWIIRGFFFSALIIVIMINYFVYNKFIWKTKG